MWAWWWAVVAWACLVQGCSPLSLEGTNHNFATTHRRTPDWTFTSPKNVRRTFLHRMWEESSQDHPLSPSAAVAAAAAVARPSPPGPPQLNDNSLLLGDEDYDDTPSELWLSQATLHPHLLPHLHGSSSLNGLQHLLEGKMNPRVEQVNPQGGAARKEEEEEEEEEAGSSGVPFSKPHLGQHQLFGEDLDMFPQGGSSSISSEGEQITDLTGPPVQPPALGRYNYHHQTLDSPSTLSKELLKDILSQLAVEQLGRHGQFSDGFLGHSPFMENDELNHLPPDLLPDDQYPRSLPREEMFLKNLLDESQLTKNGNTQTDPLNRVGAPDYPDHAAIPDLLSSHQSFGEFMHQDSYAAPSQNGDLQGLPSQDGEGGGSGWLPSTLSRLNLPSSKDLIKTCHALHLRICGGRVIEAFSHHPNYAETCRIREEFLDCMEKKQKELCRFRGQHFTEEETQRIINRIKKLLWSARGCILSHSP